MSFNPYEPPQSTNNGQPSTRRGIFRLAAIGAWLACAYWAIVTFLMVATARAGSTSTLSMILPAILIGLYGWRGSQLWAGDGMAARKILWLHGVGGLFVIVHLFMNGTGDATYVALNGVKIVIHLFGGITAYMATKQPVSAIAD